MTAKIYEDVTACRICGKSLELILNYGPMPLAGAFEEKGKQASSTLIPLMLMWCSNCHLLQTGESVDRDTLFRDYSYHSSAAPPLVRHFTKLAPIIAGHSLIGGRPGLVVEIGCNDGILLNHLAKMNVPVLGIDPSDVALRASQERRWPLVNDYLSSDVARQVVQDYGHAATVVASNVLAHNDNILELMEAVAILVGEEGKFICEVQYAGDLVNRTQFDTVYHEHAVYYSIAALKKLLAMQNLHIWSVEHIPVHSGSIRVLASKRSLMEHCLPYEPRLDIYDFRKRALRARDIISNVVEMLYDSGATIWAYGAAGRCTVLLNWCELGYVVDAVVDASPRRVGRVVPGTGTRILSVSALEQAEPRALLVTAWNYFDEIRSQHPNYDGFWIQPLPELRIL